MAESDGPRPFSLADNFVLTGRDGTMSISPKAGMPPRIDGWTIGMHTIGGESPHGGELHPDSEELLIVVSGEVTVLLEGHDEIVVGPGEACIVPRNVWHRLRSTPNTVLIHSTPGPGFDVRPLPT